MAVVSITAYEPVEVDLWGEKFETVDVNRATQKKASRTETDLEAMLTEPPDPEALKAAEEDPEKEDALLEEWMARVIAKMGELLDLKLRPVEGTKKASTHIKREWKKENLTLEQLQRFMEHVTRAEGEANRPS